MGEVTQLGSIQLRLNTVENSRRSFARIIRMYLNGELEREQYRDLCYGLGIFLTFWKLEKDLEIEKDLTRIKAHLGID